MKHIKQHWDTLLVTIVTIVIIAGLAVTAGPKQASYGKPPIVVDATRYSTITHISEYAPDAQVFIMRWAEQGYRVTHMQAFQDSDHGGANLGPVLIVMEK